MLKYKLGKNIKTGEIISIQEASKGLSCDCICPDCEKEFIAAQGEKNDWHFRHYKETDCAGGQETALHILAKKILTDNSKIYLPRYGEIVYENPIPEKYFKNIKPDITATINGHNLFFEILVTHPVDSDKENFFMQNECKSVEIDLKNFNFLSFENLKKEILDNIENKRVIYWEKEERKDNFLLIILLFILGLFTAIWLKSKMRYKRRRRYS